MNVLYKYSTGERWLPTRIARILRGTFHLYYDGFRTMTLGRTLWKIIIIKLILFLGVLKLFFFQDFLGTRFDTEQQKAEYVLNEITDNSGSRYIPTFLNKEELDND